MRERVADRLPKFSDRDKALIKGSCDFFGLNHYTTMYAAHAEGRDIDTSPYGNGGISEDQDVHLSTDKSWEKTQMGWNIVPWGLRKLLHWIDERYNHPPIVITENGCACNDRVTGDKVHDPQRIQFLSDYLSEAHRAIQEGVDLRGYFLWSFMDNFEWALGFSRRFGIHYTDYKTLRRIPKDSAFWYSQVIQNNGF